MCYLFNVDMLEFKVIEETSIDDKSVFFYPIEILRPFLNTLIGTF